jgi:hypothetical protein
MVLLDRALIEFQIEYQPRCTTVIVRNTCLKQKNHRVANRSNDDP